MAFVDPVRHCQPCSEVTASEAVFFDNGLKSLFNGAPFKIAKSNAINGNSLYNLKLSPEERFLKFEAMENEAESLNDIDLEKILTFDGQDKNSRFSLRIRESATEEIELNFECPAEPSRKPSLAFAAALEEAVNLVHDSKAFCREDNQEERVAD